jgi:hypothetical protein
MGKQDEGKTVTRRDVLKLAGTAAAFCTSFGFLHGGQPGAAVEGKHLKYEVNKELQIKWQQAEIKWYKGSELLSSSPVPSKVLKHLGSDLNATVEIKLFRTGQMLRNLGTLEAKH